MADLLAIETSCDETAATILRGTGQVLGDVVLSQALEHARFGGVVPEVASRSHLEALPLVIRDVVQSANLELEDLDAFAATTGPGLAPALLVGANAARGMALGTGKPFLPVNHIEGHLLSPFFGEPVIPPHVALVVSGGHTLLFDVKGFRDYELMGRTLDDAAGEAFDKVAKMLGLGYPGGLEIDRLAREGDPARVAFPRGLLNQPNCDFSFSGLKTSVRYFLEKHEGEIALPDLCASFQEAVVEVLSKKLRRAARARSRRLATMSGGVSSNERLRQATRNLLANEGIDLKVAAPELRTDNARMIAYVAALQFASGEQKVPSDEITPNFSPATFPF